MENLINKLIQYRLRKGYENTFQVAKEFDLNHEAIYKLENSGRIPSIMTIYAIGYIYKLKEDEIKELLELRKELL